MTKSKADLERISKTNLMPAYFKRVQFKEDSIRAFKWYQTTKDSSYIKRFVKTAVKMPSHPADKKQPVQASDELMAILPDRNPFFKTVNSKRA
jgi:penicillin-binding protein 2